LDLRRLNAIVKPIYNVLPRMQDLLEKISAWKPTCYSCLDMKSAFNSISLSKNSSKYVSFSTIKGHYSMLRLPQGLSQSPTVFQRLANEIFDDFHFQYIAIYLDDLLLASQSSAQHITHLRQCFERMRFSKLKFNPDKYHFMLPEINFLGHTLKATGVKIDQNRTKAIETLPHPTNHKTLKRALGSFAFFRRFLPGFSLLVAPMYNILKKGVPFSWNDECKSSFDKIKSMILSPICLEWPDLNSDFYLFTDGSKKAAGFILSKRS